MSLTAKPLPLIWGLLPALATWLGMYVLDEALVAVLIYHAGILCCMFWKRYPVRQSFQGWDFRVGLILGLLCLSTWPLIQLLWPLMVQPGVELSALLVKWRISGPMVWVFIFYSITLHPWLEEGFWRGMMPDRWQSDLLFAAFHLLVLFPLVHWVWLPVVFLALTVASAIWRWWTRKSGGLFLPVFTHAVADLGVVLAVSQLLKP